MVTRGRSPGGGHQGVVIRGWSPGGGHQGAITRGRSPGGGHQGVVSVGGHQGTVSSGRSPVGGHQWAVAWRLEATAQMQPRLRDTRLRSLSFSSERVFVLQI